MNSPRVLLLDEPLGALDLKLRKQMQLELKAIQHEFGITFVHVTHDQEEAMTMADTIAVMQGGRIEQLGTPDRALRAAADRLRRRLPRRLEPAPRDGRGPDLGAARRRRRGARRREALAGRTGKVAVGIRPEKIRLGSADTNVFTGRVAESAYVGVSTQYIVDDGGGRTDGVRAEHAARSGGDRTGRPAVELSFAPEAAFVVDVGRQEED